VGRAEPLVLKRVDKAAIDAMAPKRPQEAAIAAAPLPYVEEEVHFESSAPSALKMIGDWVVDHAK
jgi:hypothetical protein